LQESIDELDQQVRQQAMAHPQARRLMTHPGVGWVTALGTEVFLGDPQRFADGKAVASYIGMIPSEYSSGGRQRLGAMSKEGNALLRYLWCEAAMHAVRYDAELKRFYRRKLVQKGMGKARVAASGFTNSYLQQTDDVLICRVKFPARKWRDATIRACIDASLAKSAPALREPKWVSRICGALLTAQPRKWIPSQRR
jgi:hypothetical protein